MFSFFKKKETVVIRPRSSHPISRKLISKEALKVLYRLSGAGYKAYLVGGGVRDILLGRAPKDFDVSTDAQPKEIKRLFPRCFLVGKRFRLAHVVFGKTVIETSTFRRQPPQDAEDGDLYQSDDNTFGTPEEDALRRDFTVNGLFYDIKTFNVIDYVGGLKDLDRKILRSIGDPNLRFREDPVRMMRAVRLSAKLGLSIEKTAYAAIKKHHGEIEKASSPRVLEEIFRMFSFSATEQSFKLLYETGLLSELMPVVDGFIKESGGRKSKIWEILRHFDSLAEGKGEALSNGLRLAVLYLAPFQEELSLLQKPAGREQRLEIAEKILKNVSAKYKIPRAAFFHASHLLEELSCFEKKPPHGRRIRASRAEQFRDAIILGRIAMQVYGAISADVMEEWASLKVQEPSRGPAPGQERKDSRFRGKRPEKSAGEFADE